MIKIDSIKLQTSTANIKELNIGAFDKKDFLPAGQTESYSTYSKQGIGVGIKNITLNEKSQQVTLELSSKILLDNYFDLININTIGQVFENINKSGFIELDSSNLNEYTALSLDTTSNLKPTFTTSALVDTLRMTQNDKYKVETYKGTSAENKNKRGGITICGRQVSFKERQIVYNKYLEISKDKGYIKAIKNPLIVLSQFVGVSRVESNFSQFRKIREYCGTQTNLLGDILNSPAINPNFKLWQKIRSKQPLQLTLFDIDEDTTLHEIEINFGRRHIIKNLNYDISLIKDFLHKHKKGNISTTIKAYSILCNQLYLEAEKRNVDDDNAIISEYEQLLKTA